MLMTEPQQWGMNQSSQQFHQKRTRERYVSFLLGNITWPRLVWVVPNHDLSGWYPHDHNLSGWYPHDYNLCGPWPRLVRVVPMWPQLVWVVPTWPQLVWPMTTTCQGGTNVTTTCLGGTQPWLVWVIPTICLGGTHMMTGRGGTHMTITCLACDHDLPGYITEWCLYIQERKNPVHIQVNNWSGECALISQIIITIMHKLKKKKKKREKNAFFFIFFCNHKVNKIIQILLHDQENIHIDITQLWWKQEGH